MWEWGERDIFVRKLWSMQFTEIVFAVFLTVVFSLYWLVLRRWVKAQNWLLLGASYLFYGWWDWRFLGLIMLTTVTTFVSALYAHGRWGKVVTVANIVANVGILVAFKYLNFFSENLGRLFDLVGWNLDWFTVDVLLPVGISFYTFQAIAYSVDVYKGRVKACADPVAFATFIAYFPQLVAGPIERASQLLPQISAPREWNEGRAVSGLRMILYGVMKKVCIADMLALYADRLYAGNLDNPVLNVAAGVVFSLEIYCDFSAYSEIARGVSRLLGIELMANFRFPYFSRNILEFWRRWHVSLMWWFRDYVYIPMGGSRKGIGRTIVNTLVVFLLSGLWHGAAWNFIAWGAYWALVYVCGKFLLHLSRRDGPIVFKDLPDMVLTFGVVAFGFYIFRCNDWSQVAAGGMNVWAYIVAFGGLWCVAKLVCEHRWAKIAILIAGGACAAAACWWMAPRWPFMLKMWWLAPGALALWTEWQSRNMDFALERMSERRWRRVAFYWVCIAMIVISEPVEMTFIYFQF